MVTVPPRNRAPHDDPKNEVRLLDWDEVQALLRALKQSFAEQTAGAHRNLGLPDLIVAGQAQVVRMQESLDPLFLVSVEKLIDDRHCDQTGQCALKKQPVVDAGK